MSQAMEGQKAPVAAFRTLAENGLATVTSDQIFAGRKVIVFALPGAFTPTCSSTHLPRYEELAGVFSGLGIDDIYCLSVNDAFVMSAWGKQIGAHKVKLLADGGGEFTEAMGMLVDKAELGFGKRSWRYSMLISDGVIEKMFVEPQQPGDPFVVSDADTMLKYVAPDGTAAPDSVAIFSRPGCPHCARAKAALDQAGLSYAEFELGSGIGVSALRAVSGRTSVPQVFIEGRHIGGADELEELLRQRNAA